MTAVAGGSPVMPLTILTGFDRQTVNDLGTGLLLRVPRLALVWADPFTAELGYVQTRVTDSDGRCSERTLQLRHGCLSCAMREGVLDAVRGLAGTGRYDSILVHLHPGIESDAAIEALDAGLTGVAAIDTVVTVLRHGWLDELAGATTATERGIDVAAGDDRSAAVILAAELEAATAVVFLDGMVTGPSLEEHAAFSVLVPEAVRVYPATVLDVDAELMLRTGAYDAGARNRLARRGLLDPHLALPAPSGDIALVRWRTRRPLHPARLFAALHELADGVIRSTGYLWFGTRPEVVVGWDSAGDCLHLGPDGRWTGTDGSDADTPATIGYSHRWRASAGRLPDRYGERASMIAFLGDGLDAEHLRAVLDRCRLTDAELALGPEGWATLDDPFPDWSDTYVDDTNADDAVSSEEGAA